MLSLSRLKFVSLLSNRIEDIPFEPSPTAKSFKGLLARIDESMSCGPEPDKMIQTIFDTVTLGMMILDLILRLLFFKIVSFSE